MASVGSALGAKSVAIVRYLEAGPKNIDHSVEHWKTSNHNIFHRFELFAKTLSCISDCATSREGDGDEP